MMKKKTFGWIALSLVGLIIVFLVGRRGVEFVVQGPRQEQGDTDLRFTEVPTDFVHTSDFVAALPFMALSAIDVDVDGVDEIFVGGGIGQQDALLSYTQAGLTTLRNGYQTLKDLSDTTYGAASIDATNDGLPDLFVARSSGIYLYVNTGNGFAGEKVSIPLDSKSMPLSIAFADLNKDGAVDLYLSNYIRPEFVEGQTVFNDLEYGGVNNLLLNNGDNTFTDITRQAGVFHQHNSFVSVFVDLDDDGNSELIIAHDTGVPTIYRNNGDLTFSEINLPVTNSYPMGIAVSDYNNDGLLDLYFSNVGNTLPEMMLRGDLRDDQVLHTDYILLENKGGLVFEDVANQHNAATYGFGWGVVSSDFNNDTLADYLVTQNYIRFPGVRTGLFRLYPGSLLEQKPDGNFVPVEEVAGIANQNFGVTIVVTDFNQDGWPDAVIGNLDGELRAFLNNGGANHWLKVRLPDAPESIGALVSLKTASGQRYVNQFYTSEGLGSDQSSELFFGLGNVDSLEVLKIKFQNGAIQEFSQPRVDSVIEVEIPVR